MEIYDSHTPEELNTEGIDITSSQYDELAMLDLSCNCKCSVYEVLKILKVLGLI